MAEKIILDTDIGSDIDDAVCLAYLLANPECELMGITTVSGESLLRAQMCSVLCKVAGEEVPIYPGIEKPIFVQCRQPKAPQATQLSNWDHQESFVQGKAIAFLQEMIHSYPGEITLLPIGPLTNIGLLFAMDPEIPGLLKRLVLMGGKFTGAHNFYTAEWNIWNDPHAAAIVYRAQVPVHRSIGLDVTMSVQMDSKGVQERFTHPLLQPVADFAGVWFEHAKTMTFHDPLAGAAIFDANICEFVRGDIQVEMNSPLFEGYTHWKANPEGMHEAALAVKPDLFFDHYFRQFS